MKELILKAKQSNWGIIGPGSWTSAKENDTIIYACDGDAWEFIQYDNGKEIWKRDIGHIYEIQPLEELAKILRDIGYSISK